MLFTQSQTFSNINNCIVYIHIYIWAMLFFNITHFYIVIEICQNNNTYTNTIKAFETVTIALSTGICKDALYNSNFYEAIQAWPKGRLKVNGVFAYKLCFERVCTQTYAKSTKYQRNSNVLFVFIGFYQQSARFAMHP